jgi:hypothetical protein
MLKKLFRDMINWATSDDREQDTMNSIGTRARPGRGTISANTDLDSSDGLHFTVFGATGGKVIKVSSYDRHTDRTSSNLYVIVDGEDLGQEISQIITRESLSR